MVMCPVTQRNPVRLWEVVLPGALLFTLSLAVNATAAVNAHLLGGHWGAHGARCDAVGLIDIPAVSLRRVLLPRLSIPG